MKKILFSLFTLAALSVITLNAANDKPADWKGRDKKPCNLTVAKDGSLEVKNKEFYVFSTKQYEIDPAATYVLSGKFRKLAENVKVPLYFGFALYDKNGKWIHGMEATPYPTTETVLTEAAKKGSRILKVKDASKWRKQTPYIAFNVKSDLSDLPNRDISPAIVHCVKKGDVWQITLRYGLKKDYPAGTKVRQQSGPPYRYICSGRQLKTDWTTFKSGRIKGFGTKHTQFWNGAKYIKIVIFSNIGRNVSLAMKDVDFQITK